MVVEHGAGVNDIKKIRGFRRLVPQNQISNEKGHGIIPRLFLQKYKERRMKMNKKS